MSKRSKKAAPAGGASSEGREAEAAPTPEAPVGARAATPDVTDEVLEAAAAAAADGEQAESQHADEAGSAGAADAGAAPAAPDAGTTKERKRARPSLPPPPPERLVGAVEALLLAAGDALTPERLRDVLGLPSAVHVREAIDQVRARWSAAGLSVELQDVAGGVRVVTRPEYGEYVRRLQRHVVDGKLSQGLLETLSIVAYRQPVARPEIERIRGVQVGEALRSLLERNLVKVVGRSDQPGRPMLYGTTRRFLTSFGLGDVKDLPSAKDLARL
jgi:segregation and condensation protein B